MQLEDYFDFQRDDDIRIKGHRIGIESVLYEYIHRAQTPEEIQQRFPTLTLEEVYATILYYLRNREKVDKYIADWLNYGFEARKKQQADPAFIALARRLQQARAAKMKANHDATVSAR